MTRSLIVAIGCLFVLTACTEKPQEIGGAKKLDTPAWQGTGTVYDASGWKAGDEKAWDAQIKERARSQDEYQRIGGTS